MSVRHTATCSASTKDGQNCIIMSFIVCSLHQIVVG